METLNATQAAQLSDELMDKIPCKVLETAAVSGGKRAAQLRTEVLRWLPWTLSSGEANRRVEDALDWFQARGDIEKGSGGRYRCLPPYLVGAAEEDTHIRYALYGDPRAELSLSHALQPLQARLQYSNPPVEDEPQASRGWERGLSVPRVHLPDVLARCEEAGVSTFSRQVLVESLPELTQVTTPPDEALSTTVPSSGFWDFYQPATEQQDRWMATKYWRNANSPLVRWKPSEDWLGARESRYFYHAGAGRVAELDADTANLWQLYLDNGAGRQRLAWWDGTRLWVPRVLPAATYQWLMLLAAGSARRVGGWSVLEIDHAMYEGMREALESTLGLRFLEGKPEYLGPRRRGRESR